MRRCTARFCDVCYNREDEFREMVAVPIMIASGRSITVTFCGRCLVKMWECYVRGTP